MVSQTATVDSMSTPSVSEESAGTERFFVAHTESSNPLHNLFKLLRYGSLANIAAPRRVLEGRNYTTTWRESFVLFAIEVLRLLNTPAGALGRIIEATGNTIVANGGLVKTLLRLPLSALFGFQRGPLIVPAIGSVDYSTFIGQLDPRTDLFVDICTSDQAQGTADIFAGLVNGTRGVVDVMLMASKVAYENEAIVQKIVNSFWKMNLVGFYSCWNEFQQRSAKKAILFTDQPKDANAIVLAWRGTEPFDTYDWSTDIDFSWYELKGGTGKVHVGFLEALGLGSRHDMDTFAHIQKKACIVKQEPLNLRVDGQRSGAAVPQDIGDAQEKILAYYYITKVVKELLHANPKARLFITGHSLGGALAVLYAGMLHYFQEQELADRIAGVYTFGQPRVGDAEFAKFMLEKLSPERYYRVVYCNDIVPRLPFDDHLFEFKHWGSCFYFNSLYEGQTLEEAPNKNYFNLADFLGLHANALWELTNSLFIITRVHGSEYKESLASTLFRFIALILPGLGGHSPVNYVNAVRLGGPMPLIAKKNYISFT